MAQHRNNLIEKVNRCGNTASCHHEVGKNAIRLKIYAVHDAHDIQANPAHEQLNKYGEHNYYSQYSQHNEVEAAAPARVRPNVSQAQKLRFIDKAHGKQNCLRGEVERTEVKLSVVAHHALHRKFGQALNEVEKKQRREEGIALAKKASHLGHAPGTRLVGFEQRKWEGYKYKRKRGNNSCSHTGNRQAT